MATEIYKYEMFNEGAFDLRSYIKYKPAGEESGHWKSTEKGGMIMLHQSQSVDPRDLGIPEGAKMKLVGSIEAQHDHDANEDFIFNSNAKVRANYVMTGSLFEAHITFQKTS